MKTTRLSKNTKPDCCKRLTADLVYTLVLLGLMLFLLIVSLAACSPRKILYPQSVIDACPYEHELIPQGPLTEETLRSLVKNHDLDHKCINYLKRLLAPHTKALKKTVIPGTLDAATPRAHYKIYILASNPYLTYLRIEEAIASWNRALGRNVLSITFNFREANIILTPTNTLSENNPGVSIVSAANPCLLFVKSDLPHPEPNLEVVAHEIGHCLGLDHCGDSCGVMQANGYVGHHEIDEESIRILKEFNPYLRDNPHGGVDTTQLPSPQEP